MDVTLDVTQALKDAENSLRDFIGLKLSRSMGSEWLESLGFDPVKKIEKWKERKEEERKKQDTGVVDERLVYYIDFYDLVTIINKRWEKDFKEVFGDKREIELWLKALEDMRNTDAHRRELMPHQKHLAIGIAGEIRAKIVRYRSKMEKGKDYFPRIEAARDSFGHMVTPEDNVCFTERTLRVGDRIEFVVTASDPQGGELLYSMQVTDGRRTEWSKKNEISVTVDRLMIGRTITFQLQIASQREYHAIGIIDDFAEFVYSIIPNEL